jgi:prepilin-type N-terminal cleavage/methylation domain-containing protein
MNSPKKEAGFTLLEILIAIAILAFGLLAVATMQATAIKGNARAIGISEGVTLAQDRAELIEQLAYNDATLSDGGGTNDGSAGLDDNLANSDQQDLNNPVKLVPSGRDYYIYWNVVEDWPITNTKTIRVFVTWTERGAQKSVAVDLMKADII